MIKIIKGKYKNISMRIDTNLDIVVKCPQRVSDNKVEQFIQSHQKWIISQQNKILKAKDILSGYDLENNIYLFGRPIEFKGDKKSEYMRLFNDYILTLLENISQKLKIAYNQVSFINSVRVWGSLDRYKNMKLNIKLLLLDKNLVEYVIIHELCHSLQFNHSVKFWKEVEKYCPNYKSLRGELQKYSQLLKEKIF